VSISYITLALSFRPFMTVKTSPSINLSTNKLEVNAIREKIQLVKSKQQGEEKKRKEETEDISSLTKKLKVLDIDFEPYIEDYVLENYFKLHNLVGFQMKGNSLLSFFPSLLTFSLYMIDISLLILYIIYMNEGWVTSNSRGMICHRPHCKHVITGNSINILPSNLKYYRKCFYCQPPITQHPYKTVTIAI